MIKNAVVTGCGHAQGIGFAVAKKLSQEGYRVLLMDIEDSQASLIENCNSISEDALENHSENLSENEWAVADVTNLNELKSSISDFCSRHGKIQTAVSCAGVGVGSEVFLDSTDQDWELSWKVNVLGVRNVCIAAIGNMDITQPNSIVNIASLSGLGALAGIPACYTASKFAAIGLTKQIAMEYANQNIRVNAVCPGSVDTQMRTTALNMLASAEGLTIEQAEAFENEMIAMNRPGQAAEVADVVSFLVSDQSSYMTGNAIEVAGGMGRGI